MNGDLTLALDRAIVAALDYTVGVVSALTIGGSWDEVEKSTAKLQAAGAVLEWEVEKLLTRRGLCSETAVYDDQTVALLLGGAGSWPEIPNGTAIPERSATNH